MPEVQKLKAVIQQSRQNILFGAGHYGQMVLSLTPGYWIKIIDNNIKSGGVLHGIEVASAEEILRHPESRIFLAVRKIGHHYEEEIAAQLNSMGIPENRVIRIDRLIHQIEMEQYFDLPELNHDASEVFVDAGAYTGDTIESFLQWTTGFERIFAFEPDSSNLEKCRIRTEKLSISNKVKYFPCGLSDHEGIVAFENGAGIGSRIDANGSMNVSIMPLDKAVGDTRITFLKMDIEGEELAALHGAAATIQRCHPKLAVCIYHKPEDILEIPSYILSLDRSYRLYLRHYALHASETVLYAV